MSNEYAEFEDGPDSSQLQTITEAVDAFLEAQVEAAQAEALYKEKAKIVSRFQEHLIPEAMRDAGMKEFTTTGGYKVKIKSDVRASIPAAMKAKAYKWLEDNGHGGLIKRTVEVAFAMGEDEKAIELMDRLNEEQFSVDNRKKVESSSLRALLRRMLEDNKTKIPMDIFGASEYDKAEVKSPKKERDAAQRTAGRKREHCKTKNRKPLWLPKNHPSPLLWQKTNPAALLPFPMTTAISPVRVRRT